MDNFGPNSDFEKKTFFEKNIGNPWNCPLFLSVTWHVKNLKSLKKTCNFEGISTKIGQKLIKIQQEEVVS